MTRSRKPKIKKQSLRRGRHRGAIYTTESGRSVFLAHKHIKDIFRNGAQTISHAIRAEAAYWSIDEGLLMEARGKGIEMVGVIVKETGDIYLTFLSYFFGDELARLSHPWVRANERYMGFQHFRIRLGNVKS